MMDDKDFSLQKEDKEKIETSVKLHTPLEITSYTLPKNMEVYIQEVLSEFLLQCHQDHMIEYLKFCVGELLTNAKKANTKRVYFKEKNLDINKELDYNEGMVFFKEETLNNIDHYLEEQKKAGLYVKLVLQVDENFVKIEIRNNAVLTRFENQRIIEKISIAQQYDSIEDVFTKVLDQTEGAGLGIIIIILMLQKIGLSKQNYKVFTTDKETITRIELPLNEKITENLDFLAEDFARTQTTVPVIKKKLYELNKLLNAPDISISELLDFFSKDVTLTFLLIKDAIAAKNHCCSMLDAIDYHGIKNLKNIFTESNPQIRLINSPNPENDWWEHSSKVAFYAYNLAKNFPPKDTVTPDLIFVYAMMHDIECVFLSVITDIQRNKINEDSRVNAISDVALEMFYNERCHCKAGSLLATSWGFSECVSEIIRYHNAPERAPEAYKDIVNYVYLADIIQYYIERKVEYYQLNQNVLKYFGIDSEGKLDYIIKQIKSVI